MGSLKCSFHSRSSYSFHTRVSVLHLRELCCRVFETARAELRGISRTAARRAGEPKAFMNSGWERRRVCAMVGYGGEGLAALGLPWPWAIAQKRWPRAALRSQVMSREK